MQNKRRPQPSEEVGSPEAEETRKEHELEPEAQRQDTLREKAVGDQVLSTAPKKKKKTATAEDKTENKDGQISGRWSKEECMAFDAALDKYGDNWPKIREMVGTRTRAQVMSHAQKHYNKQKRIQLQQWQAEDEKRKEQEISQQLPPGQYLTFPMKRIFNIVRHYRSPSAIQTKEPYELEYKVVMVPKSQLPQRTSRPPKARLSHSPRRRPPKRSKTPSVPAEDRRRNLDIAFEREEPLNFLSDFADPVPEQEAEPSPNNEDRIGGTLRPRFTSLLGIAIDN
jgi:SHAQKYF class myb-like DNA-binding protein